MADRPRAILRTSRLDLVAATAPVLMAEMEGPDALARLLEARVGADWPPALYDAEALEWSLDQVRADPRFEVWGMRYVVLRDSDPGGPEVVGVAGFKGPPTGGEVEVGYAIVTAVQRRGLATEAVLALVELAFAHDGVVRVVAHTLPDLAPSLGVLRKAGFRFDGDIEDDGVALVRYARGRTR